MTLDPTDTRSDLELLGAARKGDQRAFGQLAAKYYHNCVRVATSILRDPSDAEDEVQQALRKAFQHVDQYLGQADFVVWLLHIVVNECRMSLRYKKRAQAHFVYLTDSREHRQRELPSQTNDPEHETIVEDMVQVLRREIRRVPPFLREVLLLRDIDGCPLPEIAGRLGITVPAAKSRLMRARAELRKRMMDRFGLCRHTMPFRAVAIPSARAV